VKHIVQVLEKLGPKLLQLILYLHNNTKTEQERLSQHRDSWKVVTMYLKFSNWLPKSKGEGTTFNLLCHNTKPDALILFPGHKCHLNDVHGYSMT